MFQIPEHQILISLQFIESKWILNWNIKIVLLARLETVKEKKACLNTSIGACEKDNDVFEVGQKHQSCLVFKFAI